MKEHSRRLNAYYDACRPWGGKPDMPAAVGCRKPAVGGLLVGESDNLSLQ